MFEGHGMVLERGVKVGLGGVSGVTGLRKEAEVREAEPFHHFRLLSETGQFGSTPHGGMNQHKNPAGHAEEEIK
jgi:hypothetical protein